MVDRGQGGRGPLPLIGFGVIMDPDDALAHVRRRRRLVQALHRPSSTWGRAWSADKTNALTNTDSRSLLGTGVPLGGVSRTSMHARTWARPRGVS